MPNAGIALVALLALLTPASVTAAPRAEHAATCARQSTATFDGAFTSRENLVVGPLAMMGAGRPTSKATVREFGGNKFPLVVRPRRVVTVKVVSDGASLFYAHRGGGALTETDVEDGHRTVAFRPCRARDATSRADGDPVTFWSGFVVVERPLCVRLRVWVGNGRARRARIPLGRAC